MSSQLTKIDIGISATDRTKIAEGLSSCHRFLRGPEN